MDGLAELIPLLLVGAYYLLQGRRRAAQRRAQQEATAEPERREAAERAPSPFQAFVQQIEDAMAEASGEARDEDQTPPPAEPAAAPPARPAVRVATPRARTPEFRAPAGSFDSLAPTDHQAHGFGSDNPLSEETFERRPAFGPRPREAARTYDPHGLRRTEPAPPPRSTWRATLRDPKAARDAFVLQTIFGPRGGRRADPR